MGKHGFKDKKIWAYNNFAQQWSQTIDPRSIEYIDEWLILGRRGEHLFQVQTRLDQYVIDVKL